MQTLLLCLLRLGDDDSFFAGLSSVPLARAEPNSDFQLSVVAAIAKVGASRLLELLIYNLPGQASRYGKLQPSPSRPTLVLHHHYCSISVPLLPHCRYIPVALLRRHRCMVVGTLPSRALLLAAF